MALEGSLRSLPQHGGAKPALSRAAYWKLANMRSLKPLRVGSACTVDAPPPWDTVDPGLAQAEFCIDNTTYSGFHVPPILISSQANGGIQGPLHIPIVDVEL